MTHREKVDRAIADLTKRGVGLSTCAPPAWRTAWGLGLKIPPPHFMGFVPLALLTGSFFGALWALAMWLLVWRSLGLLFTAAAGAAAGVLFGLCMAVYYRHSAAKLKLPSWGRYPNA